MVEASAEFRKNSFNDDDSARLAKVATVFQNVADESISAGESASFIISQMKAFNIEAANAEHIIDAVNAVSNSYAVSSGDLANSLGNMSATMAVGNNTFEESLGMLTAMTEITQNATKGSRALVTIQSRLNQIVDESSDTGKALTAWYVEHNIATKDAEGQMRSLYEVLSDVAKIWPKLTKNEQMYYLQQQAGTNQTQNLASLLSNYNTALNATETALNSVGSAMKENEKYMDGLEAKEAILKAEFEDFSNRVLSDEFVGALIDAGSQLLEFVNTDMGAATTRIVGISATITSSIAAIGSLGAKLASLRKIIGTGSFLGTLISPKSLLIIGGISAAIVSIAEAIDYFKEKAESLKYENLVENLVTQKEELKETEQGYADAKSRLDELNKTPYADRTAEMDAEIKQLEKQIEAYERLLKLRRGDVNDAAKGVLGGQVTTGYKAGGTSGGEIVGEYGTLITSHFNYELTAEQIASVTKEYKSEEEAIDGVFNALSDLIDKQTMEDYLSYMSTGQFTEAYNTAKLALEEMNIKIGEVRTDASQFTKEQTVQLSKTADTLTRFGEVSDSYKEESRELLENSRGIYDALMELPESDLEDWQVSFIDNWEKLNNALANTQPSAEGVSEEMDKIDISAQNAISALQAYAESVGSVSEADAALVDSLFDVNGNLTSAAQTALTADGALASFAASIVESQQKQATANYSTLIAALSEVGSAAAMSTSQIIGMFSAAGVQIDEEFAERKYNVLSSTGKTNLSYEEFLKNEYQPEATKIYEQKMAEYAEQLKNITPYIPSSGGGGGGGGSSVTSKENKDAKKEVINTVEELREYLTDESTRLKLLNPEQSETDLKELITSMADMYQRYQEYLQQLISQGFDETSDEYKNAEKEWNEFLGVLLEKFKDVIQEGGIEVQELVAMITELLDELGASADQLTTFFLSMLDNLDNSVSVASMKVMGAIERFEFERDLIHSTYAELSAAQEEAAADAIKNAKGEANVAQEVAEEYERQNQLLEDKIALEEKLEALERAKQRRMLVYSEGRFQYMQDVDAISEAQTAYDTTYRGIEQRQIQDMLDMLGENSSEFFANWVSEHKDDNNPLAGYKNALIDAQMSYLSENISGTLFEDLSDSELYKIFGEAMKPGEAYEAYAAQLAAIAAARAEADEADKKRRQEIREKNVKYWMEQGVTDFGQKILESESAEEAAYWSNLRDTKLEMIKADKESYGNDYASEKWGTAVSESDSWKSNEQLFKEKWNNLNDDSLATSIEDFHRDAYVVPEDEYTVKNPELTTAEYNVAEGLHYDQYSKADQRLYDDIFGERITKDQLQELYNSNELSDKTKGYILNLANEMREAGYPGYKNGTTGVGAYHGNKMARPWTLGLQSNANQQMAIVGEDGPELRVLNQGDGILPSVVTENLWQWGSLTPGDMAKSIASFASSAREQLQQLNISNVTLPNVRDAESFVSGLRQLANQYIAKRN